MVQYIQNFVINQQIATNTSIISCLMPSILKCQYHTVKHEGLVEFIRQKRTLKPLLTEWGRGFCVNIIQSKW